MSAVLSPSVARNRLPLLNVLRSQIESELRPTNPQQPIQVLEVAAGTGEHAAYFCSEIPHLVYQPTEPDASKIESIRCWSEKLGVCHASSDATSESISTVLSALSVDALQLTDLSKLPLNMQTTGVDLLLCINMIHISPFSSTQQLFQAAHTVLRPGGLVLLYGPFQDVNEEGQTLPLCPSNAAFDVSLRERDSQWGIRSLGDVRGVAATCSLTLQQRVEMPANNLCVVFKKTEE